IVPRQIGCVGPAEPVPFRPGSRIEMWRRHSCLRVKAAFQPPVLLEHGTGKSREPTGWKTCATNAALPTHQDRGIKRGSPASHPGVRLKVRVNFMRQFEGPFEKRCVWD